ncbi:MAG: hypothetical protein ABR595_01385 [Psychroflexus sp.]
MTRFIKLFSIFMIFCFSCEDASQNETKLSEAEKRNEIKQKPDNSAGLLMPEDHEFYSIETFEDADAFYRSIDSKYSDKSYTKTLRQLTLAGLFYQGLIKKSDSKEKLFYLEEMSKLDNCLPNLENFADLLDSVKNSKSISKEEVSKLAQTFYEKNLSVIKSADWQDQKSMNKKIAAVEQIKTEFDTK